MGLVGEADGMTRTTPFDTKVDRYEQWFETHPAAYRSEVAALKRVCPPVDAGLAVGVGTGRFAAPLGIDRGVDPSRPMLRRAYRRGIEPIQGVGEALPVADSAVDVALLVTSICFLDDRSAAFEELRRVLMPESALLIGFVDAESPLGQRYQHETGSPFYQDAEFVTTTTLIEELQTAGFTVDATVQTLFEPPTALDSPDRVEDGHGEGSFVVLRARSD